jgi:membrane protein YdbS with pleckstrin-like domain
MSNKSMIVVDIVTIIFAIGFFIIGGIINAVNLGITDGLWFVFLLGILLIVFATRDLVKYRVSSNE